MPVLSLPLTFANSFWSQDYRKGLQVLYGKLEQVCSAMGLVHTDSRCARRVGHRRERRNRYFHSGTSCGLVFCFTGWGAQPNFQARAANEQALGQSLAAPAPSGPRGACSALAWTISPPKAQQNAALARTRARRCSSHSGRSRQSPSTRARRISLSPKNSTRPSRTRSKSGPRRTRCGTCLALPACTGSCARVQSRVQQNRNLLLDGWLQAYEDGVAEVRMPNMLLF